MSVAGPGSAPGSGGWATLALVLGALWPLLDAWWRRRRPGRPARGNRFRGLSVGAWRRFGLAPLLALPLAGQAGALVHLPSAFARAGDALGLGGGPDAWLLGSVLAGVLLGMVVGTGITAWRAHRGRAEARWFGDFSGLEAWTRADRRWALLLSLSAGVTEELYFRLLLPLAAVGTGLGAVAGFAGATLIFGWAHRYQGWRGVAATTLVGAVLAALYVASGSLVLVMAYHALIDAMGLVVRPWVRERVLARRGRGNTPAAISPPSSRS